MKAFTDTYNFVAGMVVTIMTAVFGVYWYIFAAYMFFNIASSFGIPLYKPYMLVVYEEGSPTTIANSIQIITGIGFYGHKWGFQESHGLRVIKRRTLINGIWKGWEEI